MTDSPNFNPYSPPVSTDLQPPVVVRDRPARSNLVVVLLLVLVGSLMAAWIFTFVTIYSILYSGPALGILATILAIVSFRIAQPLLGWLSLSTACFVILIFALINLIPWGPDAATLPVRVMGGLYTVGAVATAIAFLARR